MVASSFWTDPTRGAQPGPAIPKTEAKTMPQTSYAVIGANWGDEGKGLAVDALAYRLMTEGKRVTVVRSNGGAQAGHGVQRPDGGRHVFHHIGSGTFAGAETHLSQFFIAHPMMLQQELADLALLGATPLGITIDPRAAVTTPWDMAINQAIESQRDAGRHGSCGLGIGETIERQEKGPALCAEDLWSDDLRQRLEQIRDTWVPKRLAALGLDVQASPLRDVLTGKADLIAPYLRNCAEFTAKVSLRPDTELEDCEVVVFEGAQGLQLDMAWGVFPHVTRSHTGIRNMLTIAEEAQIREIKAIYMTRAYATRHGAGPLPYEMPGPDGVGKIDWADIVDLTNAQNTWQGVIREAPLDLSLLRDTITRDLGLAKGAPVKVKAGLGLTCLDQLRGAATVYLDGVARSVTAEDLPDVIADFVGLPINLISKGPTRSSAAIALNEASIPGENPGQGGKNS